VIYFICVRDLYRYWLRHLRFCPETNNGPFALFVVLALVTAVKIGSVFSVKMKRAQDRKAVLDNGIQKKRVLLEALERGSASAAIAPALDGMDKAVRIGRKERADRDARISEFGLGGIKIAQGASKSARDARAKRSRCKDIRIQTGRKQNRTGR